MKDVNEKRIIRKLDKLLKRRKFKNRIYDNPEALIAFFGEIVDLGIKYPTGKKVLYDYLQKWFSFHVRPYEIINNLILYIHEILTLYNDDIKEWNFLKSYYWNESKDRLRHYENNGDEAKVELEEFLRNDYPREKEYFTNTAYYLAYVKKVIELGNKYPKERVWLALATDRAVFIESESERKYINRIHFRILLFCDYYKLEGYNTIPYLYEKTKNQLETDWLIIERCVKYNEIKLKELRK